MGYQDRDKHIVDYSMYEIPGVAPYPGGGKFRGPPVTGANYIACVGAAQTFGCLSEQPFPAILADRLGIEVLNLGYGGAGPTFHNSNRVLLDCINNAKVAVLQVLAGRSQSNSMFRTTHHAMEGVRSSDGPHMTAEDFFSDLILNQPSVIPHLIAETRRNYVADMIRLLRDIRPPKILFWFSVRTPEYKEQVTLPIWRFWGEFPQFVNRKCIDKLLPFCDDYVECVTRKGLPQKLFDKDGQPTSISHCYSISNPTVHRDTQNNYYPSPEMHEIAAQSLLPSCKALLHLEKKTSA